MKNIRFKFIGVLILMALALGSCKKWIDTGINTNPDAPSDIPMSSLLPAIEANMAYNTIGGNDYSRVTSEWMQYYMGVARQSQGESNYIWHDGDVDNLWNTNYAGSMMDLVQLTAKATGDKTYAGIADVLMAEAIGTTTDIWGDVPFSEAFQGTANLSPVFDPQQAIYATIQTLLDDAIVKLSDPAALVVHGDLIYGGDPALWLKAAHGMKARYTLHLCKRDNTAFANALTELTGSLASNNDDMQFLFVAQQGYQNPLYQFMNQRGDITMHKTFIDMLKFRLDPRLYVFASVGPDTLDPYQGTDWGGTGENASLPGPAVASQSSPVFFLTYAECLFIKTECEFKTGVGDAQVKADLVAAVGASMDKFGVYNPIYMAAYDSAIQDPLITGAVLYKEIMTQKYIAMYNQGESFVDWRRTENAIGLVANPTSSAVKNEIPRRYPYSLGEKSYNTNTPLNVTMWDRVWWDAQTVTK